MGRCTIFKQLCIGTLFLSENSLGRAEYGEQWSQKAVSLTLYGHAGLLVNTRAFNLIFSISQCRIIQRCCSLAHHACLKSALVGLNAHHQAKLLVYSGLKKPSCWCAVVSKSRLIDRYGHAGLLVNGYGCVARMRREFGNFCHYFTRRPHVPYRFMRKMWQSIPKFVPVREGYPHEWLSIACFRAKKSSWACVQKITKYEPPWLGI